MKSSKGSDGQLVGLRRSKRKEAIAFVQNTLPANSNVQQSTLKPTDLLFD